MQDSNKSHNAKSDYYGSDKVICRNYIPAPKRPLEIVEYIRKQDALLEAELRRVEQELVDLYGHK